MVSLLVFIHNCLHFLRDVLSKLIEGIDRKYVIARQRQLERLEKEGQYTWEFDPTADDRFHEEHR